MLLDFAPMEGITTAAYRQIQHRYFPGVDRYYTPFLAPTQDHVFQARELREVLPENNQGITLIPQLLTKSAEDFLWAAGELYAMGYEEINLNLGCPSGTVTAKGKGAGMLRDLEALDRFLDAIFSGSPCAISIKTRLGLEQPEEFPPILEIYDRYPLSELIIHPRVRKDFYRYPTHPEVFDWAYSQRKYPLSYNGGLVTRADLLACQKKYPGLKAVMMGQGLVSDPGFASKLKYGTVVTKDQLEQFYGELFETYSDLFHSRANAVHRLKEIWFTQIHLFKDSEKYGKRLVKTRTPEDYLEVVRSIFRDLELLEDSTGGW